MEKDSSPFYFLSDFQPHLWESSADSPSAKDLLKDQKHFTISLFNSLRESCLILDNNLRVKSVNERFLELFQVEKANTKGKLLYELGNGQWNIPELKSLLEEVLPQEKKIKDYKVTHEFEGIGYRVMLLNACMIDHLQLILITIEDITDRAKYLNDLNKTRNQLETKVRESKNRIENLAIRLTRSEQKEREKFSSLLHDDLQQILVALQMNLKSQNMRAAKENLSDIMRNDFKQNLILIDKAINATRELTSDLNPSILKTEDLNEILYWMKHKFQNLYDFNVDLIINNKFVITNKHLRLDFVQILRECLFNVVKHAEVNEAKIFVNKSDHDSVIFHLVDHGKGFDIEQEDFNYGLSNTKDRVDLHSGRIDLESAQGKGTKITIEFPTHKGIDVAPSG